MRHRQCYRIIKKMAVADYLSRERLQYGTVQTNMLLLESGLGRSPCVIGAVSHVIGSSGNHRHNDKSC